MTKVRLKVVAELVTSVDDRLELPYLALEDIEGGQGRLVGEAESALRIGTPAGMATARPGDVLFGKLRPYLRKSFLVTESIHASSELLTIRPGPSLNSRWLSHLVASHPFVGWAIATSEGTKMPRTSWERLAEFRFAPPPVDEQRRIADFLDAETARIDALIEKKRRMVELLDQRWLTTLESVMAASERRVTALKRVAVLIAGGTPSTDEPEAWDAGGVPWVAIGDMSGTRLVEHTKRAVSVHGLRSARLIVGAPGTVLFAMYASVGAVSRLGVSACWNQAILGISGERDLALSDFLELWLQRLRPRLAELFRSNTQNNLNADQVGSLPFPILSIAEQRAIVERLRGVRGRRDRLTQRLDRQIDLLKERRQALITAAVTGQMEILGVTA